MRNSQVTRFYQAEAAELSFQQQVATLERERLLAKQKAAQLEQQLRGGSVALEMKASEQLLQHKQQQQLQQQMQREREATAEALRRVEHLTLVRRCCLQSVACPASGA